MQESKVHLVREVLKEREVPRDPQVPLGQKVRREKLVLMVGLEERAHLDLQGHQETEELPDYQVQRVLLVVEVLKAHKESVETQVSQVKKGLTVHLV